MSFCITERKYLYIRHSDKNMQNTLYYPGELTLSSETYITPCDPCSLFDRPSDCSLMFPWSCCLLQEDAEALRRDAGQTRSGAHLVRAHHRERRRRASVRPRRGTETTLWDSWTHIYIKLKRLIRERHQTLYSPCDLMTSKIRQ